IHLSNVYYFSSRRRHTITKRDWSSDVCFFRSLGYDRTVTYHQGASAADPHDDTSQFDRTRANFSLTRSSPSANLVSVKSVSSDQIGRASCRERAYISILVLCRWMSSVDVCVAI